jgi:flagellar biosynthesis protein FlhG
MTGPRLTAIGSGKGGTGKTLFTLALARTLADRGERVLVCDADLGLSNTAVQLGLGRGGDLPGLLAGRTRFRDAVVHVAKGFDLLAAPAGSGALADADASTAAHLASILQHICGYDRVLIDLGAGVGGTVMTLAAQADDVLVLMTPDPASLTDAYAFVKLALQRTGGRAPALVVNMAAHAAEAARAAEALARSARSFLKVEPAYLGFVPHDPRIAHAVRRQAALHTLHPQPASLSAIAALAAAMGPKRSSIPAARTLR